MSLLFFVFSLPGFGKQACVCIWLNKDLLVNTLSPMTLRTGKWALFTC